MNIQFIARKIEVLRRELQKDNPYVITVHEKDYIAVKIPDSYLENEEKEIQFLYYLKIPTKYIQKEFEIDFLDSRVLSPQKVSHPWIKPGQRYLDDLEYSFYKDMMLEWEDKIIRVLTERKIYRSQIRKAIEAFMLNKAKEKESKIGTEYVYIIRMGDTEFYKIGYSNNPDSRLITLQNANPYTLEFVLKKRTVYAKKLETLLHQTYKDKQVKNEWFKFTEKEIEEIQNLDFHQILIKYEKYDLATI